LTLEVQGRTGSSPDKAGTGWHYQTTRVRQARQRGVTRVNQCLNPLKRGTSSNLVDMGWAAVCGSFTHTWESTRTSVIDADQEATVKACGVAVARPQGKSWAPILPTGTW
jgi:hypothetical protein